MAFFFDLEKIQNMKIWNRIQLPLKLIKIWIHFSIYYSKEYSAESKEMDLLWQEQLSNFLLRNHETPGTGFLTCQNILTLLKARWVITRYSKKNKICSILTDGGVGITQRSYLKAFWNLGKQGHCRRTLYFHMNMTYLRKSSHLIICLILTRLLVPKSF